MADYHTQSKRGRPTKYVKNENGIEIAGLSYHTATKRFYVTHSKPRHYLKSRQLDKAIAEYHEIVAEQNGSSLAATDTFVTVDKNIQSLLANSQPTDPNRLAIECIGVNPCVIESATKMMQQYKTAITPKESATIDPTSRAIMQTWIDKLEPRIVLDPVGFWSRLRTLLLDHMETVAVQTDLPWLRNIKEYKSTATDYTIDSVAHVFFARTLMDKRIENGRRQWAEFRQIVPSKMVSELDDTHFEKYRDECIKIHKEKKFSPYWLLDRFATIRQVFQYAYRNGFRGDYIKRAIEGTRVLTKPDYVKVETKPYCVTKEELDTLLAACESPLDTLIVMMGLNCGYIPVDFSHLLKSSIDLQRGTLSERRHKTSLVRTAMLLPQTIAAIQAFMASTPKNRSDYLVVTQYGTPITRSAVNCQFNRLKRRAKLKHVCMKHLRSSLKTTASDAEVYRSKINVAMGHSCSDSNYDNNYLARHPEYTAPVAAAIKAKYFS